MSIQIIGELKYAPARDIAYLFPSVVENVAQRIEKESFGPLTKILKEKNVTQAQLGQACATYAQFLVLASTEENMTLERALNEAGFFKCDPLAQIAVLFYVGATMSGTFYTGIRDVLEPNKPLPKQIRNITRWGQRARLLCSMTPTKRWFYLKSKFLRRRILSRLGITI
jgi:hypothetical protein